LVCDRAEACEHALALVTLAIHANLRMARM